MNKNARKPSADPKQEKLREDKAKLNRQISELINDTIHFKKLLNGYPSKFFNQRSKIQNPIPADPSTIVVALAADFQDIAGKANAIVQEQLEYSKTRRQKQLKQPTATQPTTTEPTQPATIEQPDLSQQLNKGLANFNSEMIKEASNPFSRFWSKIINPRFGLTPEASRVRKYRTDLLHSTISIYKGLKQLQSAIVSSGSENIFVGSKLLDQVENNYIFIASGLQNFQEALPQGVDDAGGAIESPEEKDSTSKEDKPTKEKKPKKDKKVNEAETKELLAKSDRIAQEIIRHSSLFPETYMVSLANLANLFVGAPTTKDELPAKIQMAIDLLVKYKEALAKLAQERKIPLQHSLGDIIALSNKSVAEPPLETTAQNILGKWKHQLSSADKTSAIRLDIYKVAGSARKIADQIMNHLEDNLYPETLAPLMDSLANHLLKMRTLFNSLSSLTQGEDYRPEFLRMLEKNRGIDLSHKEKSQLEKLIDQKRMRELSKMYGGR
jgi:hypothetical protein